MKLSELGEFDLIDLINNGIARFQNPEHASWQQLVLGSGDDAAAWRSINDIQLATIDTLVQDTHFDLNIITWEELGWKAMSVNLSDIAAMGGIPMYALVSLSLPKDLQVEDVCKLVDSMAYLAAQFGVAVVGGNLTNAPNIIITITIIGCSTNNTILKRSTASPGEQIVVTGHLGLSMAGLEMLKGRIVSDPEANNALRRGHLQPLPRIKEGQILVEQGVKTAIDISDGLIADLEHICESSNVNARIGIEQVPVHPIVRANFPNYQDLTLCGGEDYELLFTADKDIVTGVKQALDCPVTVIGEITEEKLSQRVTVIDSKGNIIHYERKGWEHFKNETSDIKLAQP